MQPNSQVGFPLMVGKTILYVHGFASSGQSGTVKRLRELLPEATVLAPDLPVEPQEAMTLLHSICDAEHPDLIVGTSMGGMYAEQLRGFDRILVNPALKMGETISKHHFTGRTVFLNPRQDGVQEFLMTKKLQDAYRDVTAGRFENITEEDEQRVFGLFGLEDTFVTDTFDLFAEHYSNAIHFHGEHRLNDSALIHAVIPVIRWIDDRQNRRKRPVLFVSYEDTMERQGRVSPSLEKAVRMLVATYDVYFLTKAPANDSEYVSRAAHWLFEALGVLTWNRIVSINQKQLLIGDYLIDADTTPAGFFGTHLQFGSPEFKTWDMLIEYFESLGGQ